VREYVEAFSDEGLRVGLYFSLIDWHHPDYPAKAQLRNIRPPQSPPRLANARQ